MPIALVFAKCDIYIVCNRQFNNNNVVCVVKCLYISINYMSLSVFCVPYIFLHFTFVFAHVHMHKNRTIVDG